MIIINTHCIHLYYGFGKGKTTAVYGMALRALGNGLTVTVSQFLKDGTSGENKIISDIKGLTIVEPPKKVRFSFEMTADEREKYKNFANEMLVSAFRSDSEVLILDELTDAVTEGFIDLSFLNNLINEAKSKKEIIMTGHSAPAKILEFCDYVTEFKSIKHPFKKGLSARKGIEF